MRSDKSKNSGVIFVLGGGNAERSTSGWATKSSIARYLHDLADELGRVTWMPQSSGTWGLELDEGQHNLEGALDPNKVRVVPFDYRMRRVPLLWWSLLKEVRGHQFGLFFLPAAVPFAPIIRLATRQLHRSAAYLAGDYIDAANKIDAGRWFGWSLMQRLAHIEVLQGSDFAIARGRKLASVASRYNREVHQTIPIANISFAAESSTPSDERVPNRILFVGIVAESKGVGVLLDSIAEILRGGQSVSLELCGNGPDLAKYRQQSEASGISESVNFLGWVDEPGRLDKAFSEASLLVMPSTTHPEGVPRVIDEAIARGLPIVSTTAGGVAEEFMEGEIELVRPGDLEGLTIAIRRALFDDSTRDSMLIRAHSRREWLMNSGSAGVQHARLFLQGPSGRS
jgi:glycosyltransferase involved in cell wall biosynthesis